MLGGQHAYSYYLKICQYIEPPSSYYVFCTTCLVKCVQSTSSIICYFILYLLFSNLFFLNFTEHISSDFSYWFIFKYTNQRCAGRSLQLCVCVMGNSMCISVYVHVEAGNFLLLLLNKRILVISGAKWSKLFQQSSK